MSLNDAQGDKLLIGNTKKIKTGSEKQKDWIFLTDWDWLQLFRIQNNISMYKDKNMLNSVK